MQDSEVVELRADGSPFPLDVQRKPSLSDAMRVGSVQEKYQFGLAKEALAAHLRKLADRIEAGDAIPQTCTGSVTAKYDEYVMSRLVIEYAETLT